MNLLFGEKLDIFTYESDEERKVLLMMGQKIYLDLTQEDNQSNHVVLELLHFLEALLAREHKLLLLKVMDLVHPNVQVFLIFVIRNILEILQTCVFWGWFR